MYSGSIASSGGLFGGGAYAEEARLDASRGSGGGPSDGSRRFDGISAGGMDFLSQLEQAEARDSQALGQSNASRSATKAPRPQSAYVANANRGSIVFGDDSAPEARAWSSSNEEHQLEMRLIHQEQQRQRQQQLRQHQQQRQQQQRQQRPDPQQQQQQLLREQQRQWREGQQRKQAWSDGNWQDAIDHRPMSALWDGDRRQAHAVKQLEAAGCRGADKTAGRNGGWRDVMRMNEFEMRGTAQTSVADLLSAAPPSFQPSKGHMPKKLPPSYNVAQNGSFGDVVPMRSTGGQLRLRT